MIGLVTVTPRGRRMAARLRLPDARLIAPAQVGEVFPRCSALVFFLAAGAAVRLIAPHLKDKRTDPAVVCVDEAGRFAVSLLAGHEGGANELAREVAASLGATPVVTTAGEAADLRLPRYPLTGSVKEAVGGLLAGRPVGYFGRRADQPDGTVRHDRIGDVTEDAAVIVTDRRIEARPGWAVYRPPTLVVGVGCDRAASCAAIADAVYGRLAAAGLAPESVAELASIDLKAEQLGSVAERLGVRLRTFAAHELAAVVVPHPSEAVLAAVGTRSVAEAAALLASDGGALAAPKAVCGGVTVAVARRPRRGRLAIVGLGPGEPDQMTRAAHEALSGADCVVGYQPYLDLLRPWLSGPEFRGFPIGAERERAREAVTLAAEGRTVALVSSGDAGVYGMAGLAFEALQGRGWDGRDPEVVVLPGVTAAQAAAALLGAPLGQDFAAVSLSDLHTPWETIARRIEAAASAGFLLALYNPRSARRSGHLARAAEILLRHRDGSAPVGWVRNAYRGGQEVRIAQLSELPALPADMLTMVIVGNERTTRLHGRLVTLSPREEP